MKTHVETAPRRAMKTHVETTESNRNDGSRDHFLRSGNRDSHGVDPTTELMTSSTACLGARKVLADNPMVHGVGEPCKVHQDRIYIQVEVETATWQPSHIYLHNGRCQVKAQMYYQEAKGPNQKLMSSSQECLGMNRPHKTVEYDLDSVLSKESEPSPTICQKHKVKPSLTVMSETGNGHRAN
jgi:hypothetical protein